MNNEITHIQKVTKVQSARAVIIRAAMMIAIVIALSPINVIHNITTVLPITQGTLPRPVATVVELKQPYKAVPFDEELKAHVTATAEAYGLDPALVFAVIEVESGFNTAADNGYCVGLMQISKGNYSWLHNAIGITDLAEPHQNVEAGCYILSGLVSRHSVERALVCYNCGEYANNLESSGYSQKVLSLMNKY